MNIDDILLKAKAEKALKDHKQKQFELILRMNPDTTVKNADEIKTFEEVLKEGNVEPDKRIQAALKTGEIMVYGERPIVNCNLVTTSKEEAKSFKKVYTERVLLEDIAWIDYQHGRCAKVEKIQRIDKELENERD